jgi:hypothetical protein
LVAAADTGTSNSDNITTASVRSIVGLAEPGALVELFVGTNLVGIANADVAGQWRIDETRLGPGTFSFLGRVKDRAGNLSSFSAPLTITIGGQLVSPSQPTLSPQSDLGLSNNDLITSETKPTFVGTSEANTPIQLLANDVVVGTGVADGNGHWSIRVANSLADGMYAFTAKSADAAGNSSSASLAQAVTIDTAPPSAPSLPALVPSNGVAVSNTGTVTSMKTPTFRGNADANTLVELLISGGVIASTVAIEGKWTIAVGEALDDGSYSISAQATDVAGNKSPVSSSLRITIKTPEARLALARLQNTLLLSWPNTADSFVLEAADSVSSRVWLPVDKPATVEGDSRIVILSASPANRFYRLRKQ